MKKLRVGLVEYTLMAVGLLGFILLLPILVPIELWLRHKENTEQKKRMIKKNSDR